MANGQLTTVMQHIQGIVDRSVSGDLSDAELVQRFVARRDEAAFGMLVRRHGSLVLRVCQRVLHDSHAAEDAFQATFVILARKAGAIREQTSLASWLYAVAFRVAQRARASGAKRSSCERLAADVPAYETPAEDPWLREVLDEELLRLADKFRAPLVLCYLEGKTYGQAARELGWSEGSMSRLLAQAREQLRQRLLRRGVVLSGAAVGAVLEAEAVAAVPACVIVGLVEPTLQALTTPTAAVAGMAAGGSPYAVALVQGVLRNMFLCKLKTAAFFLAIGLTVGGMGWLTLLDAAPNKQAAKPQLASLWRNPESEPFFVPEDVPPVADCPEEEAQAEKMDLGNDTAMAALSEGDPQPPLDLTDDLLQLPAPAKIAIKRRQFQTEEELRKQLQQLPELSLDTDSARTNTFALLERARQAAEATPTHATTTDYLAKRRDLIGLPLLLGKSCELDEEKSTTLRDLSRNMHQVVGESSESTTNPEIVAISLRVNFRRAGSIRTGQEPFKDRFRAAKSIPALMQILPAEAPSTRQVLVEQLGRIDAAASTQALARLAVFDISPEVRASAIEVLLTRPASDYRSVLVESLRYPWAPAADHAAEALVALQDKGSVPALKQLVDQPDPAATFLDPETKAPLVRELVRINHLRNCLMCHAPAVDRTGVVLAPVPEPGKPLPPSTFYYTPKGDMLVRAEVTYLRQDFSVAQPVEKADPWPAMQRYDYLIRTRPATTSAQPNGSPASYPQRDAVLFALKELQTP